MHLDGCVDVACTTRKTQGGAVANMEEKQPHSLLCVARSQPCVLCREVLGFKETLTLASTDVHQVPRPSNNISKILDGNG